MRFVSKKAQNIVEYLVVLTAVIAAIVTVSRSIQSAVQTRLSQSAGKVGEIINK